MTTFTDQNPSDTYDNLLQVANGSNAGLTANLEKIQDGVGQDSPVSISYTEFSIDTGSTLIADVGAIIDFADATSVNLGPATFSDIDAESVTITGDLTVGGNINIVGAIEGYHYGGTITTTPIGTGEDTLVIGEGADGGTGIDNIVMGRGATITGAGADNIMLGRGSNTDGATNAIFGLNASITAGAVDGLAIGSNAEITTTGAITPSSSMAVGNGAKNYAASAIVVGSQAVGGLIDDAVGSAGLILLGASSKGYGQDSVTIGANAGQNTVSYPNSVTIGQSIPTTAEDQFRLGTSDTHYIQLQDGELTLVGDEPHFVMPVYNVATVPSTAPANGGMIYVDDETGGGVPAFYDGTDWRRVTDRAIIS